MDEMESWKGEEVGRWEWEGEGEQTLSRTLIRALSSSSRRSLSAMRSRRDLLSSSPFLEGWALEVGPEGTVGVCRSSMCSPIVLKVGEYVQWIEMPVEDADCQEIFVALDSGPIIR